MVKFIPKHFILFDNITNGIIFLIFNCLLLFYRNITDLGLLVLYPLTLLNLFINSKNFLWGL